MKVHHSLAFVILGFISGFLFMPLFYESFYVPQGQSFFYAYQAFIAGFLAFVAAIFTVGYYFYQDFMSRRSLKGLFEQELYVAFHQINDLVPVLREVSSKEDVQYLFKHEGIPQLPAIMGSHDLIGKLNSDEALLLAAMREYHARFVKVIMSVLKARYSQSNIDNIVQIECSIAAEVGNFFCESYKDFQKK